VGFSRLAVRRQRPCRGWGGVTSEARKATVTRSNRVGCVRKARAGRAGTVAGQIATPQHFAARLRYMAMLLSSIASQDPLEMVPKLIGFVFELFEVLPRGFGHALNGDILE